MPDHQDARAPGGSEAGAGALEEALAEKTALLHEVDHRVKNNLQLVASLLLLQSRRMSDPSARDALRSMLERVSAIATVPTPMVCRLPQRMTNRAAIAVPTR